jgi:predicted DNA-binding transcriptional regulator AlpA
LSEHHLDRRAGELIAIGAGNPDDLLTTKQVAAWFGMSVITLEIWRSKGKGPPFTKLTPRMVRYQRGGVLNWLAKRTCTSTAQPTITDAITNEGLTFPFLQMGGPERRPGGRLLIEQLKRKFAAGVLGPAM